MVMSMRYILAIFDAPGCILYDNPLYDQKHLRVRGSAKVAHLLTQEWGEGKGEFSAVSQIASGSHVSSTEWSMLFSSHLGPV